MSMVFTDICLISEDVSRLKGFYEAVFETQGQGDAIHATLTLPGLTLSIDTAELKNSRAFWFVSGESAGNTLICFNVADVDEQYQRLLKLGVEMLNEPTTHPWGARAFQFRDPDGNMLTFRSWPKGD